MRRFLSVLGIGGIFMFAPFVPSAGAVQNSAQTVLTGLDNPRGLLVLPNGHLVVAEAGHAGDLCLGPGACLGLNGQITSTDLRDGHGTVLAGGLPSFGGPFGAFGLGGLANKGGHGYFVVGLNPQSFGNPTDDCQGAPDFDACVATITNVQNNAGTLNELNSLNKNNGWTELANPGKVDFDYTISHPDPGNPEFAPGDANPFGLASGPSRSFFVVDAASNTLDSVNRGDVSVLASVPDPVNHTPIYDAAPTCAAVTPNGDVYVATESNTLWRWDGAHLTKVLSGGKLGQVVGCTADREGNIYLANLASQIRGSFPDFNEQPFDGSIVKVTPQLDTSYVATGLNLPSGLALSHDEGALYVAVNGLCPSDLSLLNSENSPPGACPDPGKVIKIDLGH